jgi:uncharacterized membrane protein YedE/YeeE
MKYANAYVAGVGVGLVLLATFVLTGHGLGAIGAYSRLVDPRHEDWTLFELIGVAIGGALSAGLAGRLRLAIERGPHATPVARLATASAGGVAMGIGAKVAGGCTSGLALSGGAVLSVGAWVFIACAFAAGYAIMFVVRRLWT